MTGIHDYRFVYEELKMREREKREKTSFFGHSSIVCLSKKSVRFWRLATRYYFRPNRYLEQVVLTHYIKGIYELCMCNFYVERKRGKERDRESEKKKPMRRYKIVNGRLIMGVGLRHIWIFSRSILVHFSIFTCGIRKRCFIKIIRKA